MDASPPDVGHLPEEDQIALITDYLMQQGFDLDSIRQLYADDELLATVDDVLNELAPNHHHQPAHEQLQPPPQMWRPWEQETPATAAEDNQQQHLVNELCAYASGQALWEPSHGTGALKRPLEQTGGALGVEPQIQVVSSTRIPDQQAWDGKLIERGTSVQLTHNLHQLTDIMTAARRIDEMFGAIIQPLIADASDDDKIALIIEHEDIESGGLRVAYIKKSKFNNECVLDAIYRWVQSGSTAFLLNGRLTLRVSILREVVGRGKKKRLEGVKTTDAFFRVKPKILIEVRSSTVSCGWLAVTLAKCVVDRPEIRTACRKEWYQIMKANSDQLWEMMAALMADLPYQQPMTASHFSKIQTRLEGYQFLVIERPSLSHVSGKPISPIYRGPDSDKKVIIELHDGHYRAVTSLTGYYGKQFFCSRCWKSTGSVHQCPDACPGCGAETKCVPDMSMTECPDCFKQFSNEACKARHRCKPGKTCRKCELPLAKDHRCGVFECTSCRQTYTECPHRCFLQPLDASKLAEEDERPKIIVCFDIEARLEELINGITDHRANLLICHTLCDICAPKLSARDVDDCRVCGVEKHTFFGDDCVSRFMDYILNELSQRVAKQAVGSRIHIFSHNGRAYDHRFIMEEIFKRKIMDVAPVLQGSKVAKIDIANVRFQDSIALLPMALSAIPKAMGLNCSQLKKGAFPHHYNRRENYHITDGKWPALEEYGPGDMKTAARNELVSWYETVKHNKFHFMNELTSYCDMDVQILMSGVRKFRELFRGVTKIDPISRAFTLAGIAFEDFNAVHLKSNTIGITPHGCYLKDRNSSVPGNAWLDLIEKERSIKVNREQKIGKYWADGMYDKTVFEFNGCYFHGHDCPQGRNAEPYKKIALAEKYSYYARRGLTVVDIWECDASLLANRYFNERLKFWKNASDPAPEVRDALAGGRTENFAMAYECLEDEEIKYVDFVSLYPFVLKHRDYPIGHPQVVSENINYHPGKYFGLVRAKVLPPRDMRVPVLPYRTAGKLLFPLCRTCADLQQKTLCFHTDEERQLCGLYVSPELDLAVSHGYQITEVLYVLHWEQRSRDIFSGYIDTWIAMKVACSGFPADVQTEEQKEAFVAECKEKMGVDIAVKNICVNPGLRQISKLMLNSLWGRLAMRDNMEQTALINRYQDLIELVNDEKKVVQPAVLTGPNCEAVLVSWHFKDFRDARQGKTSPAIASFVTAYGRMHLCDLMQRLEAVRPGRCLYADTDSVIFVQKASDPTVATGSLLGELTDEAQGSRIVRGLFMAPKTYSYETIDSNNVHKSVTKAKGITLTHDAAQVVTPEQMKRLIELAGSGDVSSCVRVPQLQFMADKRTQRQRSRHFDKRLAVTTTKRRIEGMYTFPFGWSV